MQTILDFLSSLWEGLKKALSAFSSVPALLSSFLGLFWGLWEYVFSNMDCPQTLSDFVTLLQDNVDTFISWLDSTNGDNMGVAPYLCNFFAIDVLADSTISLLSATFGVSFLMLIGFLIALLGIFVVLASRWLISLVIRLCTLGHSRV